MRVGLAQLNTTVGDLAGNRRRILDAYRTLVAQGAELVLFPELVVCGYPPRDLLFKRRFVADVEQTTREIAAEIGAVPAVIGYTESNAAGPGRPAFNAAAFCRRGRIESVGRKCLLPTYDVFDEDRYFEPAREPGVVEFGGRRLGLTICEDIWTHPLIATRRLYHDLDPVRQLAAKPVDLLLNLSASPWNAGKDSVRHTLVADTARTAGCPVVYCNAVGGNDELIFDGRSVVCDARGQLIAGLGAFREELRVVDVGPAGAHAPTPPLVSPTFEQEELADIHDALVLGLRDYAHKTGFTRALLGLSGGIDSALTAVIAAEALGAENVIGISLPSDISSQHSRDDAAAVARNLGIACHTLGIAGVVAAAEATLAPLFQGRPRDATEENIQARARGLLLMAISNKSGALLLTTGNKSELAVGYCTLYGDMCGALAVIADVPKTMVYALAEWVNRKREVIPAATIAKPPSAELRPNQTDQDSLPPYDVLDRIVKMYVEDLRSVQDIADHYDFDPALVKNITDRIHINEYKRQQAAPGIKITAKAFGVGRTVPIAQKFRD